jgi:hypothetical protein
MNLWIKHPETGKYDTMLTLALTATLVVLVKFIFSDMTVGPVVFGDLDSGVIAAVLTPTLGSYCFRRHSDNQAGVGNAEKDSTNEATNEA